MNFRSGILIAHLSIRQQVVKCYWKGRCSNEIWKNQVSGDLFAIFVRCRLYFSYYRVTDQATGRTYYTNDYDRTDSGGVVFKDAKTESKVTLQSSEVREVSRQDFQAARRN